MEFFGNSDIGSKRKQNEDNFAIVKQSEPSGEGFCIVADGMGGHTHGDVASKAAVGYVVDSLVSENHMPDLSDTVLLGEYLKKVVYNTNAHVYGMCEQDEGLRGMGTTLVISCFTDERVLIANVGDSRVYLVRNGAIELLTNDNSVVGELISNGTITSGEAKEHPQRNVITRAVGTNVSLEVDIYERACEKGDIFIVCTDGLTEMLSNDEILNVVAGKDEPYAIVADLITEANAKGGLDNITVVAVVYR